MTIVSEAVVQSSDTVSTETARDVIIAALRKIVGISETPDADQTNFALEALNDMLAEWRASGADMGLTLPVALTDTLAVQDEYILGIKANLTLALCDDFDREVTPTLARRAMIGLQQIKASLLPEDRAAGVYY
jgi:hypothetical protein